MHVSAYLTKYTITYLRQCGLTTHTHTSARASLSVYLCQAVCDANEISCLFSLNTFKDFITHLVYYLHKAAVK